METSGNGIFLAVFVSVALPILLAVGGWIFTYVNSRQEAQRAAQLERVNKQLRLLYGPLYSRLVAAEAAWNAFAENYWPAHGQAGYFAEGFELSEQELARWRHWMREVFHPLNMEMEALLVENLDLLEDGKVPRSFSTALAHIYAYRAVLSQWDKQDYSEYTSVVNFPAGELMAAVRPVYENLVLKQKQLLK